MRKNKFFKYLGTTALMLLFTGGFEATAQEIAIEREVIAAHGNSDDQVSYTIGEVLVNAGSTVTLTPGFQQPGIEISDEVLGFEDLSNYIQVYPNPSADFVSLSGDKLFSIKPDVQLFDLQGNELIVPTTYSENLEFDLRDLSSGTYFLVVSNAENQTIGRFKILKIKN